MNNIGLLTRVSGRVREKGADYFLIADGTTEPGVTGPVEERTKVFCPPGVVPPVVDTFVSATGVSSCVMVDGKVRRLLRVRHQSDIQ